MKRTFRCVRHWGTLKEERSAIRRWGSAEQALLLRISSMNREYIDSKAENKEAQKANERTG